MFFNVVEREPDAAQSWYPTMGGELSNGNEPMANLRYVIDIMELSLPSKMENLGVPEPKAWVVPFSTVVIARGTSKGR